MRSFFSALLPERRCEDYRQAKNYIYYLKRRHVHDCSKRAMSILLSAAMLMGNMVAPIVRRPESKSGSLDSDTSSPDHLHISYRSLCVWGCCTFCPAYKSGRIRS